MLDNDWASPVEGIRISIAATDNFGMPIEKRGMRAVLPNDPREVEAFIDKVMVDVRDTLTFIITGRKPALPEGGTE